MTNHIVFLDNNSKLWLGLCLSVASELSKSGPVVVVDTTDLSWPTHCFLEQSSDQAVENLFKALTGKTKYKVQYIRSQFAAKVSQPYSEQSDDLVTQDAVTGTLVSFFGCTRHSRSLSWKLAEHLILRSNSRINLAMEALGSLLAKADVVVIPNGRLANHKVLLNVAKKLNRSIYYYENGVEDGQFFFQKYPTQDLKAVIDSASSLRPEIDIAGESDIGAAEDLIRRRRKGVDRGTGFLPRFQDSGDVSRKYLFATSSSDEILFLKESWSKSRFRNQIEAFSSILENVDAKGSSSLLRSHPHLRHKCYHTQISETKELIGLLGRHSDLLVIPHFRDDSTYELVDKCEAVIVSSSTLGIEAAVMGKSVTITDGNLLEYSNKVSRYFDPEGDLPKSSHARQLREDAAHLMNYLRSRDKPIPKVVREIISDHSRDGISVSGIAKFWLTNPRHMLQMYLVSLAKLSASIGKMSSKAIWLFKKANDIFLEVPFRKNT